MSSRERAVKILIEVENLTKRFGAVVAIDDISLGLRENEFFALLGPSGCGKTTLLRAIAGFERPDAGCILLDGRDLISVRANHRPVNMMFQSYALFPHMTVRENVAYGLKMEGVRGAELDRRVDEALAMVQLGAYAKRKPTHLSGGERQRVALARALVKRPRLRTGTLPLVVSPSNHEPRGIHFHPPVALHRSMKTRNDKASASSRRLAEPVFPPGAGSPLATTTVAPPRSPPPLAWL